MSAADELRRAISGLDPAFEQRMLEEFTATIARVSMIADGNGGTVLCLRLAETSSALTTCLASLMALSPQAALNEQAIAETARRFRHALHRKVGVAKRAPGTHEFLQRSFHTGQEGGRA